MPLLHSYQPCQSTEGVNKAWTPTTDMHPFFSTTTADWGVLLLLSYILSYFIWDLWEFNSVNSLMFICCTAAHNARKQCGRCAMVTGVVKGVVWWKPPPYPASLTRWACYSSRFFSFVRQVFFTCSVVKKNNMCMLHLGAVVDGIQRVTAKEWRLS